MTWQYFPFHFAGKASYEIKMKTQASEWILLEMAYNGLTSKVKFLWFYKKIQLWLSCSQYV